MAISIIKRIIIYTDGSLIGEKGGLAFMCFLSGSEIKPIVAYSNVIAKRSLAIELLAIIRALEYLYYKGLTGYEIIVKTDVKSVVRFFRKEEYNNCHSRQWKNGNGDPIKCDINEWYALTCLVESFPHGKVRFMKVKSKKNEFNKVVHKYSQIGQKVDLIDDGCLNVLEMNGDKESFIFKEFIGNIETEDIKAIINKNKPWEDNFNEKIKWYDHNNKEIVFINTKDIVLTEHVHLECKTLDFNGIINGIARTREINYPLAVRGIGDGKYSLVMGLVRYIAVKVLNIEKVPCVIINMSYEELKNQYPIG